MLTESGQRLLVLQSRRNFKNIYIIVNNNFLYILYFLSVWFF